MLYVHHTPQHDAADRLSRLVDYTAATNTIQRRGGDACQRDF